MNELVLSRGDAARLDRRIRLLVGSIADNVAKLYDLVEQAKAGQIHAALQYPSWTAYVADALKVDVRLDRDQRRELVGWLSDQGMSQRAIASVVGASIGTVNADLGVQNRTPDPADEEVVDPQEIAAGLNGLVADGLLSPDDAERFTPQPAEKKTVGTDNKSYPRPPSEPQKPRRRPITDAYRSATWDLDQAVQRLVRLTRDDRFGGHRDQLLQRNLGDLLRLVNQLDDEVLSPLSGGYQRGGEGNESLDDIEFVRRLIHDAEAVADHA